MKIKVDLPKVAIILDIILNNNIIDRGLYNIVVLTIFELLKVLLSKDKKCTFFSFSYCSYFLNERNERTNRKDKYSFLDKPVPKFNNRLTEIRAFLYYTGYPQLFSCLIS